MSRFKFSSSILQETPNKFLRLFRIKLALHCSLEVQFKCTTKDKKTLDGEPNLKCKEKYFDFFSTIRTDDLLKKLDWASRKLFKAGCSHKFKVSDWLLRKIPLFHLSVCPIRFGFKINTGSAIQFTIEISDRALYKWWAF